MSSDESNRIEQVTKLSADPEQFHSVVRLLSRPSAKFDKIVDAIIKLTPFICAVGVFFHYLTYQRRADEIGIEQQRLANQEAITRRSELETSVELKKRETVLKEAELHVLE